MPDHPHRDPMQAQIDDLRTKMQNNVNSIRHQIHEFENGKYSGRPGLHGYLFMMDRHGTQQLSTLGSFVGAAFLFIAVAFAFLLILAGGRAMGYWRPDTPYDLCSTNHYAACISHEDGAIETPGK